LLRSRRLFTKQQAENWWTDNITRLLQKYKFQAGERYTINPSSVTNKKNDMTVLTYTPMEPMEHQVEALDQWQEKYVQLRIVKFGSASLV